MIASYLASYLDERLNVVAEKTTVDHFVSAAEGFAMQSKYARIAGIPLTWRRAARGVRTKLMLSNLKAEKKRSTK